MSQEQPICKPLFHLMTPQAPAHNGDGDGDGDPDAAVCHLHPQNISWQHGESQICNGREPMAAPLLHTQTISVACSASLSPPTDDDKEQQPASICHETEQEREVAKLDRQGLGSWNAHPEKDLKKACASLINHIQWTSEKQYQEVARSSFRETVHCQATLHALHEECVERSRIFRGDQSFCEDEFRRDMRSNPTMLSLSQSQTGSPFSDITYARPFRECREERPISAPVHDRLPRIIPYREDPIHRWCMGNPEWTPEVRKGNCVGCNGVKPIVVLNPPPKNYFRSKSVEQRKPRFCTGINRGKGETLAFPEEAGKKILNVVPLITLQSDKTKGVWNRKANQKEWEGGHRGCCSQHWVSVLDGNQKVCHEGRKLSARENLSPLPKSKVEAMDKPKCQVRRTPRSLDLSSSPLSSHKAIAHDINRPQSASLPRRSDGALGVSTPRSASTCRSGRKASIPVTQARKLKNPELNSSAWLLAKIEALKNESFTIAKALQIAKEHGIVLDKEDEVALKEFLQSEESSSPVVDPAFLAAENERNKTRKYFNLRNFNTPAESSVATRRNHKQLDSKPHASRICDTPFKSDLLVAPDQCPQVCSGPSDLNLKNLGNALNWSDEENVWIERCREAHWTMNVNDSSRT